MENKKILIIDDEPDLVKTLQIRLETAGYTIITAYEGHTGLKKAREEKPDLIILDIMLPGMNGYETCDKLKSDPLTHKIPVIILTSKNMGDDLEQAFEKKADWFMVKPFDSGYLLKIVKKII